MFIDARSPLPTPIPAPVRERTVRGRNLAPGTFGAQLRGTVLLVFLRHLG